MQYILGIETSCDETAAAIVTGDQKILSNIIASQMDIHAQFGGVVPEIASRNHIQIIDKVVQQALDAAKITAKQLTAIAATVAPGLPGAVMVGRIFGESLATALGIPFIPVNHIHGHIASTFCHQDHLALVVSGGHTAIYSVKGKTITLLESTLDDAVGEAFDKVARVLGLGYPGGPKIEQLAALYRGDSVTFVKNPNFHKHGFSYSGLKTAVINYREKMDIPKICYSFQLEAFNQIIYKLRKYKPKVLCVSGGVSINKALRELLAREFPDVRFPAVELCGDNAAMIAAAAIQFRFDKF